MASDENIFAGVDISSGRRPVTFAALNDKLELVTLAQLGVTEGIACLKEYESIQLAINTPTAKGGQNIFSDFQIQMKEVGFKHFAEKNSSFLWIASNADECYRVFQPGLLSRRTLEGRIQRGLILYEAGLQINDAMDFFEEITRHKLMQGLLPTETIYTSKQLDALVMAYLAWMAGNPSEKVITRGNLYLPAAE